MIFDPRVREETDREGKKSSGKEKDEREVMK